MAYIFELNYTFYDAGCIYLWIQIFDSLVWVNRFMNVQQKRLFPECRLEGSCLLQGANSELAPLRT